MKLKDYETAESCYAKAMEYSCFLLDMMSDPQRSQLAQEECAAELFGLYLDRTAAAWQLQQQVTAVTDSCHLLCQRQTWCSSARLCCAQSRSS